MKYIASILGAVTILCLITSCGSSSDTNSETEATASTVTEDPAPAPAPTLVVAASTDDVEGEWTFHLAHEEAADGLVQEAVTEQIILHAEKEPFLTDADFDDKSAKLSNPRGINYSLTEEAHAKWQETKKDGSRHWYVIYCNGKVLTIGRASVATTSAAGNVNSMTVQGLRDQKIAMSLF